MPMAISRYSTAATSSGEQRALLAAGFRVLGERERRLLALQFFAGLSQPQVARELGISQIHVSRLTRVRS